MAAATLPTAGSPALVKTTPKSASASAQTSKSSNSRANIRVVRGENCVALAQGRDPIAVAAGDNCHAKVDATDESYMACAAAAGTGCEAEATGEGVIATVALGIAPTATSSIAATETIAIGYAPFAQVWDKKGTAIAIGTDPTTQAEEGGYLVFVDTSDTETGVAVFAVDPAKGIWPNIPYVWQRGWATPCPDWRRLDREGFERGNKFQREHPEKK
jgi:hypothetical protein